MIVVVACRPPGILQIKPRGRTLPAKSPIARWQRSVVAKVNDAVRDALDRRRRLRMLGGLLADLDAPHGSVSKALIAKYEDLLG